MDENLYYLKVTKKNKIHFKKEGYLFLRKSIQVKTIIKYLGGNYIKIPKRPGEPDKTHANIGKIKKDLGWRPKIDIKKGVNKVLKNISYWKNAPVWDERSIKIATKNWFKYLS